MSLGLLAADELRSAELEEAEDREDCWEQRLRSRETEEVKACAFDTAAHQLQRAPRPEGRDEEDLPLRE